MRILIIADTDLDGSGAATIITKYHRLFDTRSKMPPFRLQQDQIEVYFPSRVELNEVFQDDEWVNATWNSYDLIYLCDTGLDTDKGNENLGKMASKVIYFDHHETNLNRQKQYKDRYKGFHVEEGPSCTAKIAFDVLYARLARTDVAKAEKFRRLKKFSLLINDIDLWYRETERSMELADFVSVVGPQVAYEEFLTLCENPDQDTDFMAGVLVDVQKQKEKSLELAKATLVKHKGYKTPFHTCLVDDWASWVSGEICPKTGMLAMFDVSRKTLSFRVGSKYPGMEWHKTKGTKPNCLDFAEPLRGGGHPQAAGVSTNECYPIFKKLSQRLGEVLLEDYNERTRR